MQENDFGSSDTGAIALAEAVLWNKSIIALDLSSCILSPRGLLALTKAFRFNKRLLYVDLSHTCTSRMQELAVAFKMQRNASRASNDVAKKAREFCSHHFGFPEIYKEAARGESDTYLKILEGKCGVS